VKLEVCAVAVLICAQWSLWKSCFSGCRPTLRPIYDDSSRAGRCAPL